MVILIVGAIIVGILIYNNTIDKNKFVADNEKYFEMIKEDDYEFLLFARYGDDVIPSILYKKRIFNAFLIGIIFIVLFLVDLSVLNIVLAIGIAALVFKIPYIQLKSYYKAHLHEIDVMLPYYLKSLEILVQHYTVPVAIGKSIPDAPDIFKPGLKTMVEKINAGDSSIDPYMEFANTYPVRDSMRMMRLLYRLGIGSQEKKQDRLMMFSRTVSSLQNKARETKYKERLHHMESQTMIMLVVAGVGLMIVILISMLNVFAM